MSGKKQIRVIKEGIRKCGKRKEGSAYLVGEISPFGTLPSFVRIDPPIPMPGKHFRGFIVIDGDALIDGKPYEQWLRGPSKERMRKQKGDEWSIDTFGMTIYKRLHTGDTVQFKNIHEAQAYMSGLVRFNSKVDNVTQEMISNELDYPELYKKVEVMYNLKTIGTIMDVAAAVWRTADDVSPSKKKDVYPYLAKILWLINLKKDSFDLLKEASK